jgi:AraC-like DNA-binding protein
MALAAQQRWREPTLSIRLSWPFVRVAGGDNEEMQILEREGIDLAAFANPDTRIRHRASIELLEHTVARTRDAALGIRAGEAIEVSDLGVLAHVVRTCPNIRESIRCAARYAHLMNEAATITLDEGTDVAIWRWQLTDDVPQPAAANDFVVASVLTGWRKQTGLDETPIEVHFMHREASSTEAYERFFRCPIKLGMPHNAIVVRRAFLDAQLVGASHGMHVAFGKHAEAVLGRLRKDDSVSGRAREAVLAELPSGDPSMEAIARKLAMSVATLRRRLDDESTSHRQILEGVRCELAKRYLTDGSLAISEVAFLLGFSHVTAFYKAFRRWMGGTTPAGYRANALRARVTAGAGVASSG